ncbi:MAG: hypothetical protein AAF591_23235 [Verrucomicrobiota bacterium]
MNSDQKDPVEEELLLYWSGELDLERISSVEKRLSEDAAARRYLQDLESFSLCQSPLVAPRYSVAAKALEEFKQEGRSENERGRTIIPFPMAKLGAMAVAASVMISSVIVFWPGREASPPESLVDNRNEASEVEGHGAGDQGQKRDARLSQFLFAPKSSRTKEVATGFGSRVSSAHDRAKRVRSDLRSTETRTFIRKS